MYKISYKDRRIHFIAQGIQPALCNNFKWSVFYRPSRHYVILKTNGNVLNQLHFNKEKSIEERIYRTLQTTFTTFLKSKTIIKLSRYKKIDAS